jgi:PAS domain S-box-containing protein
MPLPVDDNALLSFPLVQVLAGLLLAAIGALLYTAHRRRASLRDALARLAESEDRLRLLIEHGGVGLALLSPEGYFVHANPALTRLLGYTPEELRGRRLADLTHPQDQTSSYHARAGRKKAADGGDPQHERQKRFLHKDGRELWLRVLRVPVYGPGGALRYHASVLVDVTERRRAELALAASEQRLRLRLEQAFDGIAAWTESGIFLDANPALCRLLGREHGELLRRTAVEVAADPEAMAEHLGRVRVAGADRCELRLRGPGDNPVEVEISSAVIEVEEQRLIQGILRDVTERKQAEAALLRAEQTVRAERDFGDRILQTADALIAVTDLDGRIIRFNDKCQEATGYREEVVKGRPIWDCLVPGPLRDLAHDLFRQRVQGQAPAPPPGGLPHEIVIHARGKGEPVVECPWRTRDGGERLIAWRLSVVRDGNGPGYAIGVGLDVTEQRRLEEQLAQARKMETLGALAGGIAHDFNNQLTAILGHLELALSDLRHLQHLDGKANLPEALRTLEAQLADAEEAAGRCAQTTARLLTFGRGREGPLRPLAPAAVVAEVARFLQRELPPAIRVRVDVPAGVWPVAADVGQLHEMLLDLANNARDAMAAGGVLTLGLANRDLGPKDCAASLEARPGRFVELRVEDTGAGMTPEVRARVFEPLFSTRGPGRGMGLAVVFGIVRGHKGWITVTSRPGLGSTFRVYLPALPQGKETRKGEEVSAFAPSAALAARGKPCILVADDEPLVRDLGRAVLERAGYRVMTATDGADALEVYRAGAAEIDLILLDYTMPRLTGLQVMEALHQAGSSVPVVLSSGYALEGEVHQFLAAGARAFMPKPYRPQELVQTVQRVLDQSYHLMSGSWGKPEPTPE